MAKSPELTIIIVSYNSQYWLKKTLQSLKQFYLDRSMFKVRVIVVDNDSDDDSVETVKSEFKWVDVIALAENKGFAAGNNEALKLVDSPYVMLLNSDMELTDNSNLDELITYLNNHPEVGIVGPAVRLTNGGLDMASHRGEPTPWASLTYFTGLEKLLPRTKLFGGYHQLYQDLTQPHAVDAVTGAAMMIRVSAMKRVGLLDERFFMYAEDLDWCKRFREVGYQVMFYPGVTIIHHKNKSGISSSSKQTSARTRGLFYDTMLEYYDKHYRIRYPAWVRRMVYYFIQIKKGAV